MKSLKFTLGDNNGCSFPCLPGRAARFLSFALAAVHMSSGWYLAVFQPLFLWQPPVPLPAQLLFLLLYYFRNPYFLVFSVLSLRSDWEEWSILLQRPHFLKVVAVCFLNHVPDRRIGSRHGGIFLTDIDAFGTQPFFHIWYPPPRLLSAQPFGFPEKSSDCLSNLFYPYSNCSCQPIWLEWLE